MKGFQTKFGFISDELFDELLEEVLEEMFPEEFEKMLERKYGQKSRELLSKIDKQAIIKRAMKNPD